MIVNTSKNNKLMVVIMNKLFLNRLDNIFDNYNIIINNK